MHLRQDQAPQCRSAAADTFKRTRSATKDVMLPVALSSNNCQHAVAKQRDPQSKCRAAVNIPEPERRHVEVEYHFNFFSPPTAAANAYLSTIKKLRRVRYHPKPKRTSEQAMSATRAIYSFCAASIILFETNRISPAFFFTIDCEAKKC